MPRDPRIPNGLRAVKAEMKPGHVLVTFDDGSWDLWDYDPPREGDPENTTGSFPLDPNGDFDDVAFLGEPPIAKQESPDGR